MRRRRNPEIIAGRVNNDGSIAAGDGFTVQLAATGTFVLTFAPGFRVTGIGTAVWQASTGFIVVDSATAGTVTIKTYTSANVLANFNWSFVAVGVQQ
jgi:hypothetical protein